MATVAIGELEYVVPEDIGVRGGAIVTLTGFAELPQDAFAKATGTKRVAGIDGVQRYVSPTADLTAGGNVGLSVSKTMLWVGGGLAALLLYMAMGK